MSGPGTEEQAGPFRDPLEAPSAASRTQRYKMVVIRHVKRSLGPGSGSSEQFPSLQQTESRDMNRGPFLKCLRKPTVPAPDGLITSSKEIETALRDTPREVVT